MFSCIFHILYYLHILYHIRYFFRLFSKTLAISNIFQNPSRHPWDFSRQPRVPAAHRLPDTDLHRLLRKLTHNMWAYIWPSPPTLYTGKKLQACVNSLKVLFSLGDVDEKFKSKSFMKKNIKFCLGKKSFQL
jgi:hypothetical protein